jgi:hypothetical protein
MSGSQTSNGKSFEYACLLAIYNLLSDQQEVSIVRSAPLETAERFFADAEAEFKDNLIQGANAAARVLVRLEPQLHHPDKNVPLILSLQIDAEGRKGDVRDVLCIRKQNEWEVGLSCKHNHHAVKQSRLSNTIDFGLAWFDLPCSGDYFDAIRPLFNELDDLRCSSQGKAKWSIIEDKYDHFYVPILQAFMDELKRLDAAHPNMIPERLIRYLIGKKDFYKIITDPIHRITRIEAVNLYGTLNRRAGSNKSIVNVDKLKLPTRFYHVGFKAGSKTTIEVVCDEGWTVSLRIHSASSRIEPSLKFDVNLVSLPNSIHSQIEPW